MKIEDRKYWLKKLLHDKLTDDERATLLASEPVERQGGAYLAKGLQGVERARIGAERDIL